MATTRVLKTRQRAVRAALREVELRLMTEPEICIHVYGTIGVVSVLHVEGRKKVVLARFGWNVGAP